MLYWWQAQPAQPRALTLKEVGADLPLLDEPTNRPRCRDPRLAESALLDFPGCAVVIGHDR